MTGRKPFPKKGLYKCLLILTLFFLGAAQDRYYSGSIRFDQTLVSAENLAFIEKNWERLVESGLYISSEQSSRTITLKYVTDAYEPGEPYMSALIYIFDTPLSEEYSGQPYADMKYRRYRWTDVLTGKADWLAIKNISLGVDGEYCMLTFELHNPTEMSPAPFEQILKETLAVVAD